MPKSLVVIFALLPFIVMNRNHKVAAQQHGMKQVALRFHPSLLRNIFAACVSIWIRRVIAAVTATAHFNFHM